MECTDKYRKSVTFFYELVQDVYVDTLLLQDITFF